MMHVYGPPELVPSQFGAQTAGADASVPAVPAAAAVAK